MAEKSKTITILVSSAVALILAIALITSLSEESNRKTTLTQINDEAIVISGARNGSGQMNTTYAFTLTKFPSGWKAEERGCDLQNVVIKNQSKSALTITTQYLIDTHYGNLTYKNAVGGVNMSNINTTYADYQYCADDYLNSSWGRTILNLTPGLIAVAILVIAVLLAYSLLGKQDED